jgi:hypothetical protein
LPETDFDVLVCCGLLLEATFDVCRCV